MAETIPYIVLLPLIGFIINGLLGKKMPKNVVGILGTLMVVIPFFLSVSLFLQIKETGQPIQYVWFNWITLNEITLNIGFYIDQLSVWMMMIITGIGSIIHIYSIGYMHDDEGFYKFFAYLNLFIFSMLTLIMGSSYLIMFFGWEGVGLCSYLLIGFWFKNKEYGYAARKAFVMNRIGDLGFLLGMFLIWNQFKSLDFVQILPNISMLDNSTLTAIALLLFIGAVGKSAQLPLFTWLPDAMAGPTPVSALIHAATMVTAGIYLVIRSNAIFLSSEVAQEVILVVALVTSLMAALIAIQQNDIKKVLAYSTVSQLGLMFVALGVGAYDTALFHLTTHAFFKALLFLGAGSVIHAMSGEQDIRSMGGLRKKLPSTYWTFLIGTLAIIGFPLMSGFFSKDEILARSFAYAPWVWGMVLVISILTAFYMLRLFYLTFFGDFKGTHHQKDHLHESPSSMTIPLWILAILSLAGGILNIPELFHGNHFLASWLEPVITGRVGIHEISHTTEWILMGVTTAIILGIIYYSYRKYAVNKDIAPADDKIHGLNKTFANKFYVDEIYDTVIVEPVQFGSRVAHDYMEKSFIDRIVEGFGSIVKGLANMLRKTQDGNLEIYLLGMVIGAIALFLYNYWM
ncbi:MAG: NADH-quinone oxidoreductase subunit L [Saprospiraceae bacterium]|jgi:NADH-quinone oxidoreductase subunit L|uniref:NADH-quinone oxidoreductase subunit L n=1 Tax=Candidatus Brachybacter algidus TaxID=2982024 RepID=UPI001B5C3C0A|nr:NADH-quinone oxidoreductase subunit L [Candidatus Brachybacter algidus]MBP7540280.1 NADH-quinone oxidoreductase subunit L [Saprospiraceae bacterium]MBK7603370.1 NADH-quinone oxidoreductase subunit L [Candidatus Brachybacter algidus]MBK8356778.1 NADH-quinone oxidoreductase subunit L [Candidatus Brachybacter algidus]MBK9024084.1 NADH-quinone oxidoreductase subunit L [Candidatus Brachybacter algidus]MBK9396020.1 NADH-quinone oxidoreductase subunit L [Candidatus Brachybacter algidus]